MSDSQPLLHQAANEPSPAPWLAVVQREVEALRFGTIQITVHEGRVVQVEKTERTRFDAQSRGHGRSTQ